jgi:hypothetical protein
MDVEKLILDENSILNKTARVLLILLLLIMGILAAFKFLTGVWS